MQGAGAPTIFQAVRRIVDNLVHHSMGEAAFERAIRSSFLGIVLNKTILSKYQKHIS
jgi:hypothetical protein